MGSVFCHLAEPIPWGMRHSTGNQDAASLRMTVHFEARPAAVDGFSLLSQSTSEAGKNRVAARCVHTPKARDPDMGRTMLYEGWLSC